MDNTFCLPTLARLQSLYSVLPVDGYSSGGSAGGSAGGSGSTASDTASLLARSALLPEESSPWFLHAFLSSFAVIINLTYGASVSMKKMLSPSAPAAFLLSPSMKPAYWERTVLAHSA